MFLYFIVVLVLFSYSCYNMISEEGFQPEVKMSYGLIFKCVLFK